MAVKTVLDIVKEVCYKINEPAPSSLFGSTDTNALQWLYLLYEAGEDIRAKYDYPTLKRKWSFPTEDSTKIYPLPGNFFRLLLDTQWDDTNSWALFGPVDDGNIAARDKGTTLNDTQFSFRIAGAPFQTIGAASFTTSGAYMELSPTPTGVRTLSLEYIGNNWFYPTQWVTATGYAVADIISANGHLYKCTSTVTSSDTRPSGETSVDDAGAWQQWRGLYNTITADTDYPILDPECLSHALRAAWLRAKGLDDSQFQLLAEQSASNVKGRYQGIESTNADGDTLYEFPWVSEDFVASGF
jgi:hypothetical protein